MAASASSAIVSRSRESARAWQCLKGILCVYKPSGYSVNTLVHTLERHLIGELNVLYRQELVTDLELQSSKNKAAAAAVAAAENLPAPRRSSLLLTDYSRHPNVIGPGFQTADLKTRLIHVLSHRASGLVLCGINQNQQAQALIRARLLCTYRVRCHFGMATDSGFTDGKILEKVQNPHLKRHSLDKALANIQSFHQRAAFQAAKVDVTSQRAYELAIRGPLRPQDPLQPLVFNLKCLQFDPPHLELEVTCIHESAEFLAGLVNELGNKLRTASCIESLRCVRYGFFGLEHALLVQQTRLQPVLDHLALNQKLIQDNRHFLRRRTSHFQERNVRVTTSKRKAIEPGSLNSEPYDP